MKNPTVSVIIPTYNRAHLMGRSIQSVLNQTYQDFELIIVDDGSTDNTDDIIKEFQKKDGRIKYIRHEKNKGGSAARNTGIKAARGEYVAFQDSDDEWLLEKLEKQMRIFKDVSAEVGIVYTDMWRICGGEKTYWHSPVIKPKDGIVYNQALDRFMELGTGIGIQSAIIRRKCFNIVGMFDEAFHRFIDLELFIRLSKYYHFYHINEPLVNYYNTENGISSNNGALIEAYELIFKKYSNNIVKNRKSLAKYQYLVGNILCQNDKMTQGRAYLLKAVKLYPLNIKYLVAAFVSLFGESAYRKVVRLKRRMK